MEAIKLFHGDVSEDLMLKQKPFEALRTKLLRGAAEFYGKLEAPARRPDRSRLSPAARRGLRELGELTAKIGNRAEALAVHRKALEPFAARSRLCRLPRRRQSSTSREPAGGRGLAKGFGRHGLSLSPRFRKLRLLAEKVECGSAERRGLTVLARAHLSIGGLLSGTGKPAEALAEYEKATSIRRKRPGRTPVK